jgi:hypothetical protein
MPDGSLPNQARDEADADVMAICLTISSLRQTRARLAATVPPTPADEAEKKIVLGHLSDEIDRMADWLAACMTEAWLRDRMML